MNQYVTGTVIKELREKHHLTQAELAKKLNVSDKTVSKWETAKGYPDLSLLEPIANVFGISIAELLSGYAVENVNVSANMLRSKFYVCPVCGNVIHSTGNSLISCCGITLAPLEAEAADEDHTVQIEQVEDEHYVTLCHPMTKQHYLSFLAFVTSDRIQMVKFYPEGNAETRLQLRGSGMLYWYCNHHGLFKQKWR